LRAAKRRNKLGQEIRERGATTRRGLLEATNRLLSRQSPLELSVHAIAREAGSSPATFYVYFTDVKDAIFALVEATGDEFTARVLPPLQGPWQSGQTPERVKTFVEAYYAFWKQHRRLLAVRNLESDLGDQRFANHRIDLAMPILGALTERILEARGPGNGLSRPDAWAHAVLCCASMEEMFSYPPQAYRADQPITVDHLVRAEIEIICRILGYSSHRAKAGGRLKAGTR
jgi:AcrR family transcriptional regulator